MNFCVFSIILDHTSAAEFHIRAKKGDSAVLTCSLPALDDGSSARQHVIEWVRQGYDIPILIQFGVHDPRVHPNYDGETISTDLIDFGIRLKYL